MPDDKIMARFDRIEESISGLIVGFADRDECLEMLGDKMDELLRLMTEPPPSSGGLADTLRAFATALTKLAEGVAAMDRRLAEGVAAIDERLAALERHPA
jgi:hypothetical protein